MKVNLHEATVVEGRLPWILTQPLISVLASVNYLFDHFSSLPTSGASDYENKKKQKPALSQLRPKSPGWQASRPAVVWMCPLWYFPSISPDPDNVNSVMKLLCSCPKPLSCRGKFPFCFRQTPPSAMSAPVMVTSLCLVSLSTPASPVLPDHCSQFCWVSNLHLQFILLLLCLILVYYCYIKYIMFVRVCVDSVYGHLTFVLLNRLL